MNAHSLVDLLLEVNVINVNDIDVELNKLAARLTDARAQKWFKRVVRYFVINIDRLLKEPYVAKAEPRKIHHPHDVGGGEAGGSKYYADPRGGWRVGQEPEKQEKSPLPVREQYDPKKKTYTTALHEPVVQKDIEQSFTPFKPKKAKAKSIIGEPPAKKELQPWMTAPGSEEKEFFHFDPIQVRRRELFGRLSKLINFLNYQAKLAGHRMDIEDPAKKAEAEEAEALLQQLLTVKTDDIEAFRDVMKKSYDWNTNVKERPWEFTGDGQEIAKINELTLHKVTYPETAVAMSQNTQWKTRDPRQAEQILAQNGNIYIINKAGQPYVLVNFGGQGQYDRGDAKSAANDYAINQETAHEIAPLFADREKFPIERLLKVQMLAREINIPDRSQVVMEFPDGWHLSRLTQAFDLAREGVLMNHCVGNDSYQRKLEAGTHEFYSLRDPENRSIVTIEVQRPGTVIQMKGIGNSTTFPSNVRQMLMQAIRQNNWNVQGDRHALG